MECFFFIFLVFSMVKKEYFSIGPDGATQHANTCWAVPAVSKNHWFSNFLATRCLPERNLQRGAGHQHHPLSLCSSMGRQPFVIRNVYGAVVRKASQAHSPQPGGLRNQIFRKEHERQRVSQPGYHNWVKTG